MPDQIITCPSCGTEIPLSEALTEKIRHQLESEGAKKLKKREDELAKKEQLIEKRTKDIDAQVLEKLEVEKAKLQKEAEKEAGEKVRLELSDLVKQNEEKEQQLAKMREEEFELRKQKREIEEEKKNMKLEIERKMDEERKIVLEQAKKEADEEVHLKMAEKDKQLDQMKRALEEAKRKGEQGSMQIQGDVQEDDLKMMLRGGFPIDVVEDVPTGVKGADLIQTVNTSLGQKAGIILWESKNTKAWSDSWIKKLKDDQGIVKADVCILISQALPEGVQDFGYKNGVWVCSYKSALSLVSALRFHLTQLNQIKQSLVGKDEKMEFLYNYLSGSEFRNRIENIVSAFTSMKSDLETEKRSMVRGWNKREKEIERVIMNTSGMYGDLQGIIGASSLPTVEALELPSAEALELPSGEGEEDI